MFRIYADTTGAENSGAPKDSMLGADRRYGPVSREAFPPELFRSALLISLAASVLCISPGAAFAGSAYGMGKRGTIPDTVLEHKREGSYFTAFGSPAYSPDRGFIIALLAGFYDNGGRDDEYFGYAPYSSALSIAPSWSGKGSRSITADWDAPFFRGTLSRLRARAAYSANLFEHYYGIGKDSLRPLTTPEGRQYGSFDEYYDDIRLIENGSADSYYNYYREDAMILSFSLERTVLGGVSRIICGIYAAREWIDDYSGDTVPGIPEAGGTDGEAPMPASRLLEDYLDGRVSGMGGGWDNSVRIGLVYDTRDIEANPRSGIFADMIYSVSSPAFGSGFSYSSGAAGARFYISPAPEIIDLVLASRLLCSVKTQDAPFFSMNYIPSSDRHIYGLGGESTLRGFQQSRFTGPVMALANLEARINSRTFSAGSVSVEAALVPFADIGSVCDRFEEAFSGTAKLSYGTAFRLTLNQSVILSMDIGYSDEQKGLLYLSYGGIF